MDSDTNGMTHDEVWDDSALVNSWNAALAEYKKYHSIYAKGAKPEDIQALLANRNRPDAKTETDSPGHDERGAGHQGGAETITDAAEGADASMDEGTDSSGGFVTNETKKQTPSAAGFTPQAVLGTVQDEGLKKLLMSWYYAGYYTGLYEGRQQGQQL